MTTIRNYTALKHRKAVSVRDIRLTTIRNYTALKQRNHHPSPKQVIDHYQKLHGSQTVDGGNQPEAVIDHYQKLHGSQTK